MVNIPTPDFADVFASATVVFGFLYVYSHLKSALVLFKNDSKYMKSPYVENPNVHELFKRSKKG